MYVHEKSSLRISTMMIAVERRNPAWSFMTTLMSMFLNAFWHARRARTLSPMAEIPFVFACSSRGVDVLTSFEKDSSIMRGCFSTSPGSTDFLREIAVVGSILLARFCSYSGYLLCFLFLVLNVIPRL